MEYLAYKVSETFNSTINDEAIVSQSNLVSCIPVAQRIKFSFESHLAHSLTYTGLTFLIFVLQCILV